MTSRLKTLSALIERLLSPGYSHCFRCKRPWRFVVPHSTIYDRQRGCFPLCEKCWGEITIDERIPFYEKLICEWAEYYDAEEINRLTPIVLDAVRKGK